MSSDWPVTWVKKDYHVHESHSSDAPGATVVRYCRIAEIRGIDEIAFTTHLIVRGPDVEIGVAPSRILGYLEEIEEAQDSTSVSLRAGLEVDYFPQDERLLERILDEHPLDFVLGSLHYIHEYDIGVQQGSKDFFGGRPLDEALDVYYRGWAKAVESGLFDVMAHPDYFRKHLPLTHGDPITWEQFGMAIYDAFDSLRSQGVGIEVNSSGLRHGIHEIYPLKEFLVAAREAGVDKVTVGSDSHTVEGLGENTLEAVKRLREAGYKYLCVFEERRNRKIDLSKIL